MKNRGKAGMALLLSLAVLGAALVCRAKQQEEPQAEKTIFAMDTVMSLSAVGEKAQEAVDAASSEILRLDQMLSTGNPTSMVYALNEAGEGAASEEMKILLEDSRALYEDTQGCFDITVYPVMKLWGFTNGAYHVPDEQEISEVKKLLGMDSVELVGNEIRLGKEGMEIDFGGIAKGYASSRAMEIYEEYGVTCGMVNLGGNVHTYRTKADGSRWRIAVRDPLSPESYLGVVEVADEAVITSGGYERYFEEKGQTYHHIMDPATCRPADSGLVSVTIVSADGTKADGLSTSLFIMGEERAEAYWKEHAREFEMILVEKDGTVFATEGIAERFSTDREVQIIEKEDE